MARTATTRRSAPRRSSSTKPATGSRTAATRGPARGKGATPTRNAADRASTRTTTAPRAAPGKTVAPPTRRTAAGVTEDLSAAVRLLDRHPFAPKLYAHQRTGIKFLLGHPRAGLFDDPGLGKTAQASIALELARQAGTVERALVVAPNSLLDVWADEFARVSFARMLVVRQSRDFSLRSRPFLTILNYEKVLGLLPKLLAAGFEAVVLDESHRVKNPDGKTSRALRRLAREGGRGGQIPVRWILTGTPVAERPNDLWAQLAFVQPGLLETTHDKFLARYAVKGGYQSREVIGWRDLDAIKAKVATVTLRRAKAEALDLPEKTFVRRIVPLAPEQDRAYRELRDELRTLIKTTRTEKELRAPALLARFTRLSQLASTLACVGGEDVSGKYPELLTLLEEHLAEPSRKVVIWSHFVPTLRALERRLADYNPTGIWGEVPPSQRSEIVRRFQTDRPTRVFLGHPQAAGVGLTLTAADTAIFFDRLPSLAQFRQAVDRIHRIGQRWPVTIVSLLGRGTIDVHWDRHTSRKADVADALTERDDFLQRLGRDDLLRLLE